MKFIIKTLGFLVVLAITATAYWFLLEPADREELFENTVTKVTGNSFEETFKPNSNLSMDDVKDDSLIEHARRHADPTYVCPMHPQIVKGEPGNCPICGMNLVKKALEAEDKPAMSMSETKLMPKPMTMSKPVTMDDVKDDSLIEHARRHADPTYVCPMHPQIVKGEPGNCPICGMNLVKKELEAEEKPAMTMSESEPMSKPMTMSKPVTMDDVKDDSLIEHARRHADPTYVCPMHPQIVKGEPGNCPICGMNLVKKEIEAEEKPAMSMSKAKPMSETMPKPTMTMDDVKDDSLIEHARRHADPTYVCPMHPQIVKGEPGNCPICGMNLVKKEPVADEKPAMSMNSKPKEKKIKYWVAPMDANYRRDEPGKSPMGMDLVPVYEEQGDDGGDMAMNQKDGMPVITINSSTAQNMGVRIEKAKINELSRNIKTLGSITYNEDSVHHIHARASGWVEKLYTSSLGDPVVKGKTLLEYYSPEIVAAQKDLLLAKRAGANLTLASKTRLRDLNVSDEFIEQISKSGKSQNRVPIIANHSGVVTSIGIKNGMYVTPGTQIYSIADLSSVWVIVDVFEHQLTWVKVGNKALVKVQSMSDKEWQGEVDYIYPELNPKTRTLKVRLKIPTPDQLLKPNMFADVTLLTNNKKVVSVPTESIIYYEKSPRVVKVISENKYQPVDVTIGMKSNGQVEIIDGIKEGDDILVSGQFMIDSESNLQASFRRLMGK
ncbi:efflux RND transporter periplasmic adaptor subunit [Cocleimonas sp. KMM 6892]|uniref:efflux RND transporter periplasmic adaptor subunit n=1 Tax=unclassified Cocleimonas TaxID=2639732 RepID=UPI002DB9A4B1|nr:MULTISPECIES: efflux RND transporter periplasmic adaptor subunit [unclassified Cocleimonas]MEB8432792.1 efflux RND transporter periplasmic adaptor subunit [Cocleimonas sp. KMM 6892]MEC4715651.1 efflux RND transporter periplasmic adaptor subunit [Cocleimonas sp. KMM 6895]MEC4744731.1 efflux RND transporter periplasmic adaptor subunit [Cocleimonas sp. KMM 6896]